MSACHKEQERGNTVDHFPLTRTARDLLSTLLTAIDRRVEIINDMGKGGAEYEPKSCDTCGGTGLVAVQAVASSESPNSPDASPRRDRPVRLHRNPGESDAAGYLQDATACLGRIATEPDVPTRASVPATADASIALAIPPGNPTPGVAGTAALDGRVQVPSASVDARHLWRNPPPDPPKVASAFDSGERD
ncbi:hypothetical protein FA13DRAFT_1793416 [Coprinellus micaceus]|uniref:Uncharacterized protein n=1 Tax=Coprinellus micaceus TaxID=71717 RepID=A0A4Y7T5X9_COPMI|nr:hypothetical protein FA13DRAFT_1793416 [Coprinellus micaceus]